MAYQYISEREVRRMDRLQKEGQSPAQILQSLRDGRTKRGEPGPSRSAVYTFLAGKTYTRGRSETRGRKPRLPARLVQTANRERSLKVGLVCALTA